MTLPARDLPAQDFEAALNEVQSNLDVRRLLFVVANVLVPALTMAMSDAMSGAEYPIEIAWLPRHIVWIAGAVLAAGGALITLVLARCHFGLVVNGSKIRRVISGETRRAGLNWLGVTTNFTVLTALSAGAGLALLLVAWLSPLVACSAAGAAVLFLVLQLRFAHFRANRLVSRLESRWQAGEIPLELRERHVRMSLDATTADVSVVVTMAAALFAGTFSAMTNLGGIPATLDSLPPAPLVKAHGLQALAAYTFLSLLLSARMVVRLRIALAEHSTALAALRDEPDDAWAFRPRERTFLLFLLVVILASASALILGWTLAGQTIGLAAGAATTVAMTAGYPAHLVHARWRTLRTVAKRGESPAPRGEDAGAAETGVEECEIVESRPASE